jgi:zinc transport system substrate-binding protein
MPVSSRSYSFSRLHGSAILLLFCLLVPQAGAAPNVVVSIPPIHSLVSSIMKGVSEPTLLVPGGNSPHSYSLKPSAVRQIAHADLLIWISPEFELSLKKAVTQQQNLELLTLIDLPDMHLLPARQSTSWQTDHITGDLSNHSAKEMAEVNLPDMHLWLSTENALVIVSAVAQSLSALDPANAPAYHENSIQLVDKITNTKLTIARSLQVITDAPYLVFHDAYHYFEREFSLSPIGTVTLNPERKTGIKTVLAIKQNIRSHDARCIFHEPQFQPRLLRRIAEETEIRIGELDPVGAGLRPGPDLWFDLMFSLRDNLLKCIQN